MNTADGSATPIPSSTLTTTEESQVAPTPPPTIDRAEMIGRNVARLLLDIECVLIRPDQPFTFTSGRQSPVYVDIRRLISVPMQRDQILRYAREKLAAIWNEADVIAGGETAGIPYAAFLADQIRKPMIYIRKKPKGFGRNAQIEGLLEPGQRVLLVEDLMSEGTSKTNFITAIRNAGAVCDDVFVVFNYGTKTLDGANLHCLATWEDVLAVAKLPADQEATVRTFLDELRSNTD